MDALAALSLLPDVMRLWDVAVFADGGTSSLSLARAGRAARAGTRFFKKNWR